MGLFGQRDQPRPTVRTGFKKPDAWLDRALAELESAATSPYSLVFTVSDGYSGYSAGRIAPVLVPHLQEAGHAVVGISGGEWSAPAIITVIPARAAGRAAARADYSPPSAAVPQSGVVAGQQEHARRRCVTASCPRFRHIMTQQACPDCGWHTQLA